ncbi:pyruvyl transferase [Sporolactobacillus sp. THM7-4]|nr:pyruvyl transferase [Sporolactobacillus sp. THM7-4]
MNVKRVVGYFKNNILFYYRSKIKKYDVPQGDSNLKKRKKMIVFQTPTHGNLGDQAIAFAQKNFLKKYYPDYYYIEISFHNVIAQIPFIESIINKDDILFIQGGGNIGDLYYWEENVRRLIVETFKDNCIVSFPQTISFSKSLIGKQELRKSKKIYQKNHRFILIARETKSFELMKNYFRHNKVILTPDIVLSVDQFKDTKRSGILICFRNDVEQSINHELKNTLLKEIKQNYDKVKLTDTVINKYIDENNRLTELTKIWNQFRSAEVVITDRLHGMIFAAITGTPCIVFSNYNHKVKYSYNNWLSNIENIYFYEGKNVNCSDIIRKINELKVLQLKQSKLNLVDKYLPLKNYIDRALQDNTPHAVEI